MQNCHRYVQTQVHINKMKFVIWLVSVVVLVYGQSPESIAIVKQASDVHPDGSYEWSYETQNGISAQEHGQLSGSQEPGTAAEGDFAYTAPDGTPYAVHYVADENGFQPVGDHLPVPPPIPEDIARALEWAAAHPDHDETH